MCHEAPTSGNKILLISLYSLLPFKGPAISGPIVASIGFFWLMVITGALNIIFAPLCILLCRPLQQEKDTVRTVYFLFIEIVCDMESYFSVLQMIHFILAFDAMRR